MDTGFNYYHGADPSEYDLVVSNSEGGLPSLLELGARRAEAVFWGADPEFFAPRPVEKVHDVFFYGYGDKFRRDWMAAMVGEPSRAAPELEFALGGRDFQGDTGRAWLVGDVPFNAFNARDLGLADQPQHHAPLARDRPRLVVVPAVRARRARAPRSSRTRTRGSSAGSSRGRSCSSSTTRTRRSPPTASCSTTRRRPRRWAPAPASGCSTSTPTRTARGSCSRSSASASRQARVPERRRIAIVPARNEEEAVAGVVEELRAFDPELDVVVIDDGSEDVTARARGRRRRRRRQPPLQPRHRRRRPDRLQVRARARLRHGDPARRRRPARPAADPEPARAARARRGRRRRRLALRRGRRRLQGRPSRAAPGSAGSRSSSRC